MDSGKVITLSFAYTFFHQIFLQNLNARYKLCMHLGYVISLDFLFLLKTIIFPIKLIILLHVNIITLIIFKYWLLYLTILLFKILLSFIYHYINKELYTITFVGEIIVFRWKINSNEITYPRYMHRLYLAFRFWRKIWWKNVYANESVMTLPESIQAEATLSAQTMEMNFGLLRGKESLLDIKVSMDVFLRKNKFYCLGQKGNIFNNEHFFK